MRASQLITTLLLLTCAPAIYASDVRGSHDHALFPRFAGSEIIGYLARDYDELTFALSKAYEAGTSKYALRKKQTVEGRLTRILYVVPQGRSSLQVYRNYEKAMTKAGFEPLWSCKGNGGCGWHAWFTSVQTLGGLRSYATQLDNDFRYLSAHLKRKEGDVYVSMLVYAYASSVVRAWQGRTMVELNLVELEPMKEEMVRVKAEDLAKGIQSEGHAAVHQIYFDTDSDHLKPESRDAISEIAKLLTSQPNLKVILVGHTDNQGGIQHNMDLSQRRAKAVMTSLEKDFGIAHERLGAAGIGFLAPVASNHSDAGRAKNRRVEIIEQ